MGHTLTHWPQGDTSGLGKRLLESRHYNCIKSTFHKAECSYAHNLVAGTYAESAEDTLVGISQDERMLVVEFHFIDISSKAIRLYVIHIRVRDQLTLEVIRYIRIPDSGELPLLPDPRRIRKQPR